MKAETDEGRLRRLFGLAGWTVEKVERDDLRRIDVKSPDGLSSITVGTTENGVPWEKVFEYAVKDMDRRPRTGAYRCANERVCMPYFQSRGKCGIKPHQLAGTGLERAAAAGSAEETALCLCAFAGV